MATEDIPPIESELEQVYELLAKAQQERDSFRAGNTALLEALMNILAETTDTVDDGDLFDPQGIAENTAFALLRDAGMATETAEGNYFTLNWDALDARKPKRQTWAEAVHECVTDPQEIARLLALDDEHE